MRGKQHSNGKAVLAEVSDASSFLALAGGLAGGCPALTLVDLSNNDIREGDGGAGDCAHGGRMWSTDQT